MNERRTIPAIAILSLALMNSVALRADAEQQPSPIHTRAREQITAMERDMVENFGWEQKSAAAKPASPQAEVGSTRSFWAQSFGDYQFYQVDATCRAVGEHAYFFVADAVWNRRVRQKDVDAIAEAFDSSTPANPQRGIFATDVDSFGPLPDVDGDPRIYVLLLDIEENYSGAGGNSSILGYFSGVNEYSDLLARRRGFRSNEAELLYIDCNPGVPSSALTHAVVAHELQHGIHFNADPGEEDWINEGCSTFAEIICGYTPRTPDNFRLESDDSLTRWSEQATDYEQAGMFIDYLFEHWGGLSTIRSLVQNRSTGVTGVNAVLRANGYAADFQQIFADWVVANYLDDETVDDGRYGYAAYDLARSGRFTATRVHHNLPASGAGFLPYAAAHYLYFDGADQMEFSFNGSSRSPLDVRAILFGNDGEVRVEELSLDALNRGSALFTDFTRAVVIPLVDRYTAGSASYSYTAQVPAEDLPVEDTPPSTPETVQLANDDGTYNYYAYWTNEGEGAGVRFTPDYLPVRLTSAQFFLSSLRYGQTFAVRVFADDGNGMPGEELAPATQVTASQTGWLSVDLSAADIQMEGDFHIMFQVVSATGASVFRRRYTAPSIPFLAAENFPPVSGRSWTLGYNALRRLELRPVEGFDYAIRATISPVEDALPKEVAQARPTTLSLGQNYPNPFNSSTSIPYRIATPGRVVLSIYNLLGQEVRRLVDAELPAGEHAAHWDGTDDNGRHLASGIYLVRLQSGGQIGTRRLMLLE